MEYLDNEHDHRWSERQKISLIATWSIFSTFSLFVRIPVQSDVSLEFDKYNLIGDNAIIESPINLMIMKRTPRRSLQRVNKVNHLRSWKSADGPTKHSVHFTQIPWSGALFLMKWPLRYFTDKSIRIWKISPVPETGLPLLQSHFVSS